jgi:hypothetical protein
MTWKMEILMKKRILYLLMIGILVVLTGCNKDQNADATKSTTRVPTSITLRTDLPNSILDIGDETITVDPGNKKATAHPEANPLRNAYFGDLHVHTAYSFDAFIFGTLATPYDAYRYAKGEAIRHPGGFDVQLREPLDFYAVADHAMFLGVMPAVADTNTEISRYDVYKPFHNINTPKSSLLKYLPRTIEEAIGTLDVLKRNKAFRSFLPDTIGGIMDGTIDREMALDVTRSAWMDIINAAQKHNEPGKFTTFIAYEYTSSTNDRGNLHRNVIFKDQNKVPAVPFSRFHSQNPEGLWDWMDDLRRQGIESMAIPHNSNGSNGQMFKLTDWAGNPMDDRYAEQRIRNEPIVEISQIKGASETHPALSPNDEWADFEIMPYRVATLLPSEPLGSYVRNALQRGLVMEEKNGTNPYKFGFVGSSDTHTGATSDDESNYFGKVGLPDATAQLRGSTPIPGILAWAGRKLGADAFMKRLDGEDYATTGSETYGSAGLAGVWAEGNTREAIYNAFRRKETFATSGPRIRVRFFAGFDFDDDMVQSRDMVAKAYADGVSMGGDLTARRGAAPTFLAWAVRDPRSAALQRVQIVKGWIADGKPREKVYDVACSGGLKVDPATHRCPDNGAQVNLTDCSITAGVGDAEMKTQWTDPEFDTEQRAFYYVRVLENPTCRWSTWDALRAGTELRPDMKKTIQERAWSSPIWYTP